MNEKLSALLRSRRFWAAVAGVVVAVTGGLGFEVDPETVTQICLVLSAWLISDGITKTE